jgi:hypothetical protein
MRPMLTAHLLRSLSVDAEVDPRTVVRWLAGLTGDPKKDARIAAAAAALGVTRASQPAAVKPPAA